MAQDSAQPTGGQIWPLQLLFLLTLIGGVVSWFHPRLFSDPNISAPNISAPNITYWLGVPAATCVLLGVAILCALLLYAPWVRYLGRKNTLVNDVAEIKRQLADSSSGNSRLTTLVSDVADIKRQLVDAQGGKNKFETLIGDVADFKQLITDAAKLGTHINTAPPVNTIINQLGSDAEAIKKLIAYGPLFMILLTLHSVASDLTALKAALGDAARSDGGTILARLASIESKLPPSP